jgi:hypothetical protein
MGRTRFLNCLHLTREDVFTAHLEVHAAVLLYILVQQTRLIARCQQRRVTIRIVLHQLWNHVYFLFLHRLSEVRMVQSFRSADSF